MAAETLERQTDAEDAAATVEPPEGLETIALISPGDRTGEITKPLATTGVDVTVNPGRLRGHDLILCDTPDRDMFKAVASKPIHRTPVIYRMRGDPFWGVEEWFRSRAKKAAFYWMHGQVDGCLSIAPHVAASYRRQTGVETRVVRLSTDPTNWPGPDHTDSELRLITLTNAMYWQKIEPLLDAARIVERVLEAVGGTWRIGSWSEGYGSILDSGLDGFEHVHFAGNLDAYEACSWANVMLHASGFDGALPNAVLEGLSSGLPVVTNDHDAFRQSAAPLALCRGPDGLEQTLEQLTRPGQREQLAEDGLRYVHEYHSRAHIGGEFVRAIEELVPSYLTASRDSRRASE